MLPPPSSVEEAYAGPLRRGRGGGGAGGGRAQGRRASAATAPGGLSEREVDVLRAVAEGLTNREIAARFSISPRTAEHHVQHIYDKLGFSSRAAAALFAMEHDLLD